MSQLLSRRTALGMTILGGLAANPASVSAGRSRRRCQCCCPAEPTYSSLPTSAEQNTDARIEEGRKLKRDEAITLSSKTWSNLQPDPWWFKLSDGTKLGAMSDMVVTFVRLSNGTVYVTASFDKTSRGWYTSDSGRSLHLALLNSGGGTLYTWDFSNELVVQCNWNDHHVSYTKNGLPDIYNETTGVRFYKDTSYWRQCP